MRFVLNMGLPWALSLFAFASSSPSLSAQAPEKDLAVLMLHVDFADAPGPSFTDREFESAVRSLDRYWNANSNGRMGAKGTVTNLLRMPRLLRDYNPTGTPKGGLRGDLMADALDVAEAAGYDVGAYDIHWLTPGQGTNGVAGKVWGFDPNFPGMIIHEVGHALNLPHANSWLAKDGTTLGRGYSKEYGNRFDSMGTGEHRFQRQFGAATKHLLGWLGDAEITTVTQDGIYRIQAHDRPLSGMSAALRIPRNRQQNYWVEFRSRLGDRRSSNGALIMWENISFQYLNPNKTATYTDLLDMHPVTPDTRDAPLLASDGWFVDPYAGLRIRVLGKVPTNPVSLDIEVQFMSPVTPLDTRPVLNFVQPFDGSSSLGGTTVFEVETHDPDVGTSNGEGIEHVVFEIFGQNGEKPLAVLPPVTSPPYRQTFDTSGLTDSGYTVLCRSTSTRDAGGNSATDLVYVRVRGRGANRPPRIVHKLSVPTTITSPGDFQAQIAISDPNGLENIAGVSGWILTPTKSVLGRYTLEHRGAGAYTLDVRQLSFPTPGTYWLVVRARDGAGLTRTDAASFVVR